jgi:homoaconitate hydratase
VPERTRKLPDSRDAFRLKPWQHYLLVGVILGTVFTPVWLYYDRRRARDSFVKYKIVAKDPVSSTASIFYVEPTEASKESEIYKDAWRKGIWNFHLKQPQIQIVRPYTPLPPEGGKDGKENHLLRFLIRHDPHGEVSSYIHNLPVGAYVELRGPNLEYHLTPEVRQVVFFAGGTGIAPALQIAHAMFDTERNGDEDSDGHRKGKMLHILWANRKREDCAGGLSDAPPAEPVAPKPTWSGFFTKQTPKPVPKVSEDKGAVVQELESLKSRHPGQVTVEYFVNEEDTWIDEDAVSKALSRFDDKDFSTGTTTSHEQRQILISGPPGFISYLAGPKEWRNGREEQGGISKIVAHAISKNPHNVKVWKI